MTASLGEASGIRSRPALGGRPRPTTCATSASGHGLQFKHDNDCGVVSNAQFAQILAFKLKSDRLSNVHCQFIECRSLCHHWNVEALSHVLAVSSTGAVLN